MGTHGTMLSSGARRLWRMCFVLLSFSTTILWLSAPSSTYAAAPSVTVKLTITCIGLAHSADNGDEGEVVVAVHLPNEKWWRNKPVHNSNHVCPNLVFTRTVDNWIVSDQQYGGTEFPIRLRVEDQNSGTDYLYDITPWREYGLDMSLFIEASPDPNQLICRLEFGRGFVEHSWELAPTSPVHNNSCSFRMESQGADRKRLHAHIRFNVNVNINR